MRTEFNADFAIINSGSFRSNKLIPAGPIQMSTLQNMFPFPDTMCVLEMPGSVIKEAMEESVSRLPVLDGRFLAISGFKMSYDPSKPKLQRICPEDMIQDGNIVLDLNKTYTVAINSYLAKGGDSFKMFTTDKVKVVFDHMNSIWLIDLVKKFFKGTARDYVIVPSPEPKR